MSQYPRNLLVDAGWLADHRTNPDLRILDVRGISYRLGHIPGAIALNPGRDFFIFASGFVEPAPLDKIQQCLSERGVGNESTIVLYDDSNDQPVALAYWLLRYLSHRNLKILHGGWIGWRDSGGAVSHDVPVMVPSHYRAQLTDEIFADADWIQANAQRADLVLIDARSKDEFALGHIPGAVNLPYDLSLDWRTMLFRDVETLRAQFESVGATPDKEIVVYCHRGMRSAHSFMTLQLMGYPRVRNYNGSMADWYEARQLPLGVLR